MPALPWTVWSLLWVTSGPSGGASVRSAVRGQADEIRQKADVRALTSGAEGKADHLAGTSGRGVVARSRHSWFVKYHRTLAHRDSGVGNRPLHLAQSVEVCALIYQAGILGESPHTAIP